MQGDSVMNHKDFLRIADTISVLRQEHGNDNEILNELVEVLTDTFKHNYSSFDYVQFLNDCEYAESVGA
jgi:hypothetical protein